MNVAFISPHADDVCLSLAGFASHVVADKHLVTVFSHSEWTEPDWEMPAEEDSVTALRRREDIAFCERWGFAYHELSLPDSSVRHEGRGNLRRRSGVEGELLAAAEEGLVALIEEHGFEVLIGPIGLGDHADHVVCSGATRNAAKRAGVAAFYYEDLPYACEMRLAQIRRRARRLVGGLVPVTCYSALTLDEKLMAMRVYASQHKEDIVGSVLKHSYRLKTAKRIEGIVGETREGVRVAERLWVDPKGPQPSMLCGPETDLAAQSRIGLADAILVNRSTGEVRRESY